MRKFLSRVGLAARTPDYTESWNESAKRIELVLPFTVVLPDNAQSAADLSDRVIAAVGDIQAGRIGSSLPEHVTEAHAAIVIQPTNRPLGELEEQALTILRERLGSAIAVEVTEVAAEPEPEAAPVATAEVLTPEFEWDDDTNTFKGRMPAPSRPPTSPGTHIRKSFDRIMAAIGTDKVQSLAPQDKRGTARYEITIVLPRQTQWDQRCNQVVAKIEDALLNTRVTFRVEHG
ncbi:hypothetical protein SAMN06309944_2099 [Micrococcales bacterium KH10]|nr:hypothetical protein SAMN06309944_2099 [Micrococcales bacterium KH10]